MSIRDRNAARLSRVTQSLKAIASQTAAEDAGEAATGATPIHEMPTSLDVSEHPTIAHTNELTREAVAGLHRQVAALSARNAELEIESSQQKEIRTRPALLDPKSIRQSRFRDRVDEAFRDRAFEQLKREIQSTNGNVEAIKVRPIADPVYTYEVVYGHRRHAACEALGLPVKAEIESLDQRQMLLQMWAENRGREDLSLFEEAASMQQMLDEGVFASQSDLGRHMGLTRSNLSKMLAISDVGDVAKKILKDPRDLTARIATTLRARIRENNPIVNELVTKAESSGKLTLRQLRDALTPAPGVAESFQFQGDEGVLMQGQLHGDSATLTIHQRMSKDDLEKLAAFIRTL